MICRALACIAVCAVLTSTSLAQVDQKLALVDEKLDRLRAEVEAIQFRQQKLQEEMESLQLQMAELRKQAGGAAAEELAALDSRLKKLDAARERDKQIILDTLAKELASRADAGPSTAAGGDLHEVKPGETLSAIAKAHGVTVEAIIQANHMADPNALKVGQKLAIPK